MTQSTEQAGQALHTQLARVFADSDCVHRMSWMDDAAAALTAWENRGTADLAEAAKRVIAHYKIVHAGPPGRIVTTGQSLLADLERALGNVVE